MADAMTAKISVEKAEINTATIEVQTLMVDSRKLTLSVFRQIKEENIIAIENRNFIPGLFLREYLLGTPWGTVNYFWGDQEENHDLHILWQKDNELRRCLYPKLTRLEGTLEFLKRQSMKEGIFEDDIEYAELLLELHSYFSRNLPHLMIAV